MLLDPADQSQMVRERAKVGSAVAKGDWPRRARRANALGGVVAGVLGNGS